MILDEVKSKVLEGLDLGLPPVNGCQLVHNCYDVHIRGSVREVQQAQRYISNFREAMEISLIDFFKEKQLRAVEDGVFSIRLQFDPTPGDNQIKVDAAHKIEHIKTKVSMGSQAAAEGLEPDLALQYIEVHTAPPAERFATGADSSHADRSERLGTGYELQVHEHGQSVGSFKITEGSISIGRSRSCDFVLDIPDISDLHLLLTVDDGLIFIEDCDSLNGTYVEFAEEEQSRWLVTGERVMVSGNTVVYLSRITPESMLRLTFHEVNN